MRNRNPDWIGRLLGKDFCNPTRIILTIISADRGDAWFLPISWAEQRVVAKGTGSAKHYHQLRRETPSQDQGTRSALVTLKHAVELETEIGAARLNWETANGVDEAWVSALELDLLSETALRLAWASASACRAAWESESA
jgi:hypothetical protein